jgi:hypothetical protein
MPTLRGRRRLRATSTDRSRSPRSAASHARAEMDHDRRPRSAASSEGSEVRLPSSPSPLGPKSVEPSGRELSWFDPNTGTGAHLMEWRLAANIQIGALFFAALIRCRWKVTGVFMDSGLICLKNRSEEPLLRNGLMRDITPDIRELMNKCLYFELRIYVALTDSVPVPALVRVGANLLVNDWRHHNRFWMNLQTRKSQIVFVNYAPCP